MNCHFFDSTNENCKNDSENDHASFNETNELIGYQTLADFCEIWPEHSLDVTLMSHDITLRHEDSNACIVIRIHVYITWLCKFVDHKVGWFIQMKGI